jgi:YggT family protein
VTTAVALVDAIVRYLVLAAAGAAGLVALTHWAVRAGHLAPFGRLATGVRRLSDPALRPLERGLARRGRNPQDATFWLFGITLVAGVTLLSLVRWILAMTLRAGSLAGAGPRVWLTTGIGVAFDLLMLALVVRVVGTWFGAGRHRRLRPAWVMTDWLVEPIRRRLPALGPVDVSPIVAWFVLILVRALLLAAL